MEEATNFYSQVEAPEALQRAKYLSRINKIKQIYSEQLPIPQKLNINGQQHQRIQYIKESKPFENKLLSQSGLCQPPIQFIAIKTEESIIPLSRKLIAPTVKLKESQNINPYSSTYYKSRNCSTSIDKVFHTEQNEQKEESKVVEIHMRQLPIGLLRDTTIHHDESKISKQKGTTQLSRIYNNTNNNKTQILKTLEKPIETKQNDTLRFSQTFTESSLVDDNMLLTIIPQIDVHEINVLQKDKPPSYYYKSIMDKDNNNNNRANLKLDKDLKSQLDMINRNEGELYKKPIRNKANTIDFNQNNQLIQQCQNQHQRNRSKSHLEYGKQIDLVVEVLIKEAEKDSQEKDINYSVQSKQRIFGKQDVLIRDKRAISNEEFKRSQKKDQKRQMKKYHQGEDELHKNDKVLDELLDNQKVNQDYKIKQKNSKYSTEEKEKSYLSYQQYQSLGSTVNNTECSLDEIDFQQAFGLQSMVRDYCKQSRESKNNHNNNNMIDVKQEKLQQQQLQQQLMHNSKQIKQNLTNKVKSFGEKGEEIQRIQQLTLKQKLLEEHHEQRKQQQISQQSSQNSQLQRQRSQESVISQSRRHTSLEKRYAQLMVNTNINWQFQRYNYVV